MEAPATGASQRTTLKIPLHLLRGIEQQRATVSRGLLVALLAVGALTVLLALKRKKRMVQVRYGYTRTPEEVVSLPEVVCFLLPAFDSLAPFLRASDRPMAIACDLLLL